MNSKELLNLIDKAWATRQDIRKIAGVGEQRATSIFLDIYNHLINENWNLPNSRLIPMSELVKHLNIDVDYLKKLSK